MGLDFTHCEARWGYIGFMQFRVKLAAEAGIALYCMSGFACYNGILLGWKHPDNVDIFVPEKELASMGTKYIGSQPVISWDKIKDDIVPLLNHCDCDGELTPDECRKIAPRLRELVANWPDCDYDKQQALMLADGMEFAASENKPLEFR